MLKKGPAKKVTIFINEDTQHHMTALHDSIMSFLMHKGVSGATATRAYSGFGSHQMLHTPKIEVLAQHLPIRIEFVETPEKVDEILPTLYEMVSDGLIEVQDTTVVKFARKSAKPEPKLPHERKAGAREAAARVHGRGRQVARCAALRCHRQEVAHDGYRRRDGLPRHPGIRGQRPSAQGDASSIRPAICPLWCR